MSEIDILKLGNPRLNQISTPVKKSEFKSLSPIISQLSDVLANFRKEKGFGRAIAAPQIGVLKRIIYMNIKGTELVIVNPVLENLSKETFELWDDCLSLPNLLVRVRRHKSLTLRYFDENAEERTVNLSDDLSELIQHEYDHLEGILATQRAIDQFSFRMV